MPDQEPARRGRPARVLSWVAAVAWGGLSGSVAAPPPGGVAGYAEVLEGPGPGEGRLLDRLGAEVERLFVGHEGSLLRVRCDSVFGVLAATGFFIDDQGTVLTSSSIVGNGTSVWVEQGQESHPAEVVGLDRRSSVALLRSAARGPAMRISGDATPPERAPVLVLGYPYASPAAPAFGFVMGLESYTPEGKPFCSRHVRAEVQLIPGMVGGPMIDAEGRVVGLVTGSLDRGRTTFALPSRALARVVTELNEVGTVRSGWIGIRVKQTEREGGRARLLVDEVFNQSPARAAGVLEGDALERVNGYVTRTEADVIEAFFMARVGQSIELAVERGGERMTLDVMVKERPRDLVARATSPLQFHSMGK